LLSQDSNIICIFTIIVKQGQLRYKDKTEFVSVREKQAVFAFH